MVTKVNSVADTSNYYCDFFVFLSFANNNKILFHCKDTNDMSGTFLIFFMFFIFLAQKWGMKTYQKQINYAELKNIRFFSCCLQNWKKLFFFLAQKIVQYRSSNFLSDYLTTLCCTLRLTTMTLYAMVGIRIRLQHFFYYGYLQQDGITIM